MEGMREGIAGRPGLVGVLGHPVGHSLSPRMHNAAFCAQDLDLVYVAFDVPPERLGAAVEGMRALDMPGANVTVPHKVSVMPFVDDVDPVAAQIGAINTLVNVGGHLTGHNTDVTGFAAALRSVVTQGPRGFVCVLLGAGGAARAVVAALMQEGVGTIRVHNRTPERATELCSSAAAWGDVPCTPVSGEDLAKAVREADLLVNATSVGMGGSVKESPVPVDILSSRHVVIDVVYGAQSTVLVREARARGARAVDGKEMLLMQAAGSYRLWTGLEPPIDAMRKSIDQWEG